MDVHHPYEPPAEFAARFSPGYGTLPTPVFDGKSKHSWDDAGPEEVAHVVGMYDAEIAYLDAQVSDLVSRLQAQDNADNLMIIIASDHGEELHERGGFSHGHSLYEEQVRCPLVFVWPGSVPPGVVVERPVQNIDIVPTVLDLLNVLPDGALDGTSLAARFSGECVSGPVFSQKRGEAVRRGRWKLWRDPEGVLELYDLVADPGEESNLAVEEPDTAAALHAVLRAWQESLVVPPPSADPVPNTPVDPAAVAALRALGYLE